VNRKVSLSPTNIARFKYSSFQSKLRHYPGLRTLAETITAVL